MLEISHAENALNLTFTNKALLQRALTHRSYIHENPKYPFENNERLEYLGDAVLDFLTAEYLFHHFPEMSEGRLTNLRSALVRTKQLAAFARQIDLGQAMFLGKGEEDNGGRNRSTVLADGFEALIGALYLDAGLDAVKNFFYPFLRPALDRILTNNAERDSKTLFQELAQEIYRITPTYRTINEEGPDHEKVFTVEVLLKKKGYGTGQGSKKQYAAQAAAAAGLKNLQAEVDQLLIQEGLANEAKNRGK